MPTNINTFKSFVDFVSNKVQTGNAYTIPQFNQIAHQSQIQVFEKDYQTYIQSGQITDYLRTFLKNTFLPVTVNGVANIPNDMQHLASMRYYNVGINGGTEVEVKEVKNEDWGNIQSSHLFKPSKRFPKYQELSSTFNVLPRNLGSVTLDYFKTPQQPIWNFTIANNRPVYSPTGSVDFEWSEVYLNNIASMFLSLVGINLKDIELSQFSQAFKQETNSIL